MERADLVERVHRGFEDALQTLMHLNALVECTNLHKEFVDGIDGICHRGLSVPLLFTSQTVPSVLVLVYLFVRTNHFNGPCRAVGPVCVSVYPDDNFRTNSYLT